MASLLIVEDSPEQLKLVHHILQMDGQHACRFSASASAALEVLKQHPVDIVLTDLNLPDGDGLSLIAEIRALRPTVPVILMTAEGNEETAVDAIKRGAASYIPKRLLRTWLVTEIDSVLAQSNQAQLRLELDALRVNQSERFVLPNDRSLVPGLIQHLMAKIEESRVCDEGRLMRIGIALQEALSNAIIHGNLEVTSELRGVDDDAYEHLIEERLATAPYSNRRVVVSASYGRDVCEIAIRDEGRGFKTSDIPDPTLPENMARAHGRGLLLIRTFFDDVSHNETGNEIRMSLRSPAAKLTGQPRVSGDRRRSVFT